MRKFFYDAAVFGAALVVVATGAQAKKQIVTVDMVDAGRGNGQGTMPTAINARSVIAGYYADSANVSHGFVGRASAKSITFDAPGAGVAAYQGTFPAAINLSGTITGVYNDGNPHGFVRKSDGTFETFSIETSTRPMAINDAGDVAGNARYGGFVRKADGTVEKFYVPSSDTTVATAINNKGVVAGYYDDGLGVFHGIVRAPNGKITTFDAPGFDNTQATSIDAEGDVTGYAWSGSTTQAFLRKRDGTITTFSPEGCDTAYGQGINYDGEIVGRCYGADNVNHAFLRHPDGSFEVFDAPGAGGLGTGGTELFAISANGKSVGTYQASDLSYHGFRRNAGR